MHRVVLDTNVLVSALITPAGASAQILVALHGGAFELVTSPLLLDELAEVLARPKLRRYVADGDAVAYVEEIRRASVVLVDPEPSPEQLGPDPDDEYLLALARAGSAVLVSGDSQLLELGRTLPVVSPRAFLESLE